MSTTNLAVHENDLHELELSTSFMRVNDLRFGSAFTSTSDRTKECSSNLKKYYSHVLTLSKHFDNAFNLLMSIENEIYPLSNYNDDGLAEEDIVYHTHAPASFCMTLQIPNGTDEQIEMSFSKACDQIWMSDSMLINHLYVESATITFNFRLEITLKDGAVYYYLDWTDEINLDDDLDIFEKNLNEKFNSKNMIKLIQTT